MATTERQLAAKPKTEGEEDVEAKPRHRPTLAMATAVLALATGGVGLVFTFWPGLRPDPRVTQSATLRVAAVDPGISLREARERLNLPSANLPAGRQCIPGNLYYVEEHIEGFKNRTTALSYYLYDGRTGLRIKNALRSVSGMRVETLKSTRPTDQSISVIWTRWPERPGKFFVRFELFRNGTFLNLVDTPTFTLGPHTYGNFAVGCTVGPRKGAAAKATP